MTRRPYMKPFPTIGCSAVTVSLLVFALAVVPAVAAAARLYTSTEGEPWTVYEAAPDETNRLIVKDLEGVATQTRWIEVTAPLTVLPDCVPESDGVPVALCPRSAASIDLGDRADVALMTAHFTGLQLKAGDGDDEVMAHNVSGSVFGEDGSDRIRLGGGSIDGGPGRDVIDGGPNGWELTGGSGDDLITSENRSPIMHVRADEGNDVLWLRPVVTGDWELEIYAVGGPGDDVLFVRPDANIDPDPGYPAWSWELSGDDGDDVLIGGPSRDSVSGGAGNDVLITRDGIEESAVCGDGVDIAYADPEDLVVDCETVLRAPLARVARLRGRLDRVLKRWNATSEGMPTRAHETLLGVVRATVPASRGLLARRLG